MSNLAEATENPNEKMPAGKPLDPGAAAPNDDGDSGEFGEEGTKPDHGDENRTEQEKLDEALKDPI